MIIAICFIGFAVFLLALNVWSENVVFEDDIRNLKKLVNDYAECTNRDIKTLEDEIKTLKEEVKALKDEVELSNPYSNL